MTLLILILLILVLAGGGWWGYRANPGPTFPVGAVLILVIVLIIWFAIPWGRPFP
jgi:hypothetical protein